jgi:hypothetical protein
MRKSATWTPLILPCERKPGHPWTSNNAAMVAPTLAFAVVAYWLLLSGCRVFAACSPPTAQSRQLAVHRPVYRVPDLSGAGFDGAGRPVGCLPPVRL